MLFRKEGFPEDSELVVCTVTKIQFNSVFVHLDEYDKQGMIHISEISPGRIRNIRDYVKEGKKVVCQVLRTNPDRGHIDLSLRRVNKNQHRKKMEQLKKEIKAEKIIEQIAKQNKLDVRAFYRKVFDIISEDYEYIADFFEDYIADEADFKKLNLDKKLEKELDEIVRQRIKLPSVEIKAHYKIGLFEPDGIEIIKDAFTKANKIDDEHVKITYLGAGKYEILIIAEDYKEAEDYLKKTTDTVDKVLKGVSGKIDFQREGQKA